MAYRFLGSFRSSICKRCLKFIFRYLYEICLTFLSIIHTDFILVFQEITLAENSRVLDGWINPPPPVYMQYFFFNVTNPQEFLAGKAKPHVTQMGPYTYR